MSDIPRIAREPNPAERALQLSRESPDLLVHLARNLAYDQGIEAWDGLSQVEQDKWMGIALRELEAHAASYVPTPPPPTGPKGGIRVDKARFSA